MKRTVTEIIILVVLIVIISIVRYVRWENEYQDQIDKINYSKELKEKEQQLKDLRAATKKTCDEDLEYIHEQAVYVRATYEQVDNEIANDLGLVEQSQLQ